MEDADFESFVEANQDKAFRVARSFLEDPEDARDAVQEAFVKVYRGLPSFRGEAEVSTWFRKILVNHCRDRLRRRRTLSWVTFWKSPTHEGREEAPTLETVVDPAPGAAEQWEQKAFRAALLAALKTLPRRQGEVFRLRTLGGLTLREISDALGLAEGTVKAHLFRSTKALQEALEPWREVP